MKQADEAGHRILALVRELLIELRGGEQLPPIRLESVLDRDLGFDSLSRVELLVRVERAFGVTLASELAASAETPLDLLRAALGSEATATLLRPATVPRASEGDAAVQLPHHATTLNEVLRWHHDHTPERIHLYLHTAHDEEVPLRYGEFYQRAAEVASALQRYGVEPQQSVAIMLPTGFDYLYAFFGTLLAGAIPVPIYPPVRPSQLEEHLRRHRAILDNAQAVLLITPAEARLPARLLQAAVPTLRHVVEPEQLHSEQPLAPLVVRGGDLAFLQYTSGSTGTPKGVMLTHSDLLANIRAMGEALQATPQDRFVSWLPLYHDMGLIGAWLGSLYFATPLVLLSPLTFLARPERWLQAISDHRGTLAGAPNFAYELCTQRIDDATLAQLDLSRWRFAFNGAEPVSAATLRRFQQRFARCGLRPEAIAPVYGLAEAAVGVAFPPAGRGLVVDTIARASLAEQGVAHPSDAVGSETMEVVACGQPLPGYQIRIVDPEGQPLPPRHQGRVQFRGPSATQGYYHNPEATAQLRCDGWHESGDLGYLADDDLYLTSRTKDLIIRGGRNLYPAEAEAAVGALSGVRSGCVVLFGVSDASGSTERLVLAAESRKRKPAAREQLRQQITAAVNRQIGVPPDEVLLLPPGSILKTSSGKVRRSACRDLYLRGALGRKPPSPAWQTLRIALHSLPGLAQRGFSAARRWAFASWGWSLFLLLASGSWLLTLLLPSERLRWGLLRGSGRLLARLTATRLELRLPATALPAEHLLVINHASYLDSAILVATLPQRYRFVAKAELASQRIAGPFLRRLATLFVERFDPRQGSQDATLLVEQATAQPPLAIFPEGTFGPQPGLLPFRLGAFIAASEAQIPVVPVAIHGSRQLLGANHWLPTHGSLTVTIGPPLYPEGTDWRAAIALRDQAREWIEQTLVECS